jgi:dihydropteroate synthase
LAVKDTSNYSKRTFNFKGILRSFEQPLVMGIINATPDSFYSASRVSGPDEVLRQAAAMIHDGADILDIGGYSSRPGADHISGDEELQRVIPVIERISREFPDQLISIDTFRAAVAEKALQAGASVINDISGGKADEAIFSIAARNSAPYVLMHMRGTPQTMTALSSYDNLLKDIIKELSIQVEKAKTAGLKDIIIDPGFGFSKTIPHNFELMNRLEQLHVLGFPLLVGISRKSTIYKVLGITPEESLNGTTVLNTVALMKGASILRVHDVKEAKEAVKLVEALSRH